MNEMDEKYVMALNNHTMALEMHANAMNRLSAVLESVFATGGIDGPQIRSLSSIVSEVGDIATYTKNQMSAVADTFGESAKRYSIAATEMSQAANKNLSAASEMTDASRKNISAAEEMMEAARRSR